MVSRWKFRNDMVSDVALTWQEVSATIHGTDLGAVDLGAEVLTKINIHLTCMR
jgi:hypothetical protein